MKGKKKLKFKKFFLHPVTAFLILILGTLILSGICSLLGMQATYTTIDPKTGALENTLIEVKNLFSFEGVKYLISNASTNFISFTTLSNLLIALMGLGVMQATGFLDTFIKRYLVKIDNKIITFIIIFLATISSLINDVGYVIMIPLAAMIFSKNHRNPLAGVVAAFAGVAFGYGVTLFVGTMEVGLIQTTEAAAKMIDASYHVALTSNLIIIIASSIILSIVGTIIMEKIIIPRIGKYNTKIENDFSKTEEIEIIEDVEEREQQRLKEEIYEKKGIRRCTITAIVFTLFFIYALIPHLPFSGMLLDMNEYTYLGQVFGPNSYFQDGFTFMVSLFFVLVGLSYGIGAKTIKHDKELLIESSKYIQEVTLLIPMVFFATEFIALFKETNIPTIITAWGANIINSISFTGLPLLITVVLIIALINIFTAKSKLTSTWAILAPVLVPKLMQANIAPEFTQFVLRASASMTNGITPLLPYFIIYIGYLNIYNQDKNKPITIRESLKMIRPYFLIISLAWLIIIILWYLTGIPIGPGVRPTL